MYAIRTTLAALMLCLALAACNISGKQGFSFRQNASKTDALERHLDNVAREFSIEELKHVATVPELPEGAGQMIGIITKDQRIESVDEATINRIVQPLVKRHVNKYTPEHSDFKITNADFMLFKDGGLLLSLSITTDGSLASKQVYVEPMIKGRYIVIPRQAPTYTCQVTSCPSKCRITGKLDTNTGEFSHWCQCKSSGYDKNKGCDMNVS